jgi:hypothetical protein
VPAAPVAPPPGTHRHKVQIAGGLLLQNSERPYFAPADPDPPPVTELCVFDLSDPVSPRQVGFHPVVGDGVHRLWYLEPPYACGTIPAGLPI